MKKRNILLSSILIFGMYLQAASIDFNEASRVEKRTSPLSSDTIFSYNNIIGATMHSIVHIATTQTRSQEMLHQMNPYFEQFFGRQYRQHEAPKRHSLGSGVIISENGYIVTNNHVIENADEIIVRIPGGNQEYSAKLIGKDPKSDIAVIKIDAEGLRPIAMGNSSDLKVGDVVFAIGNPFGVGQSVTQGIISAYHKNSMGINEYENFIQTDASINPGNSGGALVDSRGALIGINSAIVSSGGGNDGIGFAIEVDMVKSISKKLIENGSIERGYLGVHISGLSKELRKLYKNSEGALLNEVQENTPASKAGLQRGDLIIKVEEYKITGPAELKNRIGMYLPNTKIDITYERDGEIETTTVLLGNLNKSIASNDALLNGVTLQELDEQAHYNYRIPQDLEGVLVTAVSAESEADSQGVRQGDIIVQVEKYTISSLKELKLALKKYKGQYKRVYINRGGRIFVVALK